MPRIVFRKKFDHCVKGNIYPTTFEPLNKPIDVDDETAKIAIDEGKAIPFKEPAKIPEGKPWNPQGKQEKNPKEPGPRSQGSGQEKGPSSSDQGLASAGSR